MSPPTVVTFRLPPDTMYFVASSRTIAFHLSLLRVAPENVSPAPPKPVLVPPEPPGTFSPVSENQSKRATGAVAALLLNANMPTFAFGGSGAGRPTGVQLWPSVGKSAGSGAVESGASLRGLSPFS